METTQLTQTVNRKYLLFGPLQKMCAYPCSRCKSYTGLSILRLAVNEFQSECWKQTTVLKSNTVVIFFQPAPLTEASPSSSELGHQVTGPAPTSTSKLGEGRRSPLHAAPSTEPSAQQLSPLLTSSALSYNRSSEQLQMFPAAFNY